jgi:hypothetical protein
MIGAGPDPTPTQICFTPQGIAAVSSRGLVRRRFTLVYVTKGITLEPGDIILTGTPSGVGHAHKPDPIWMRAGDVCEIEIEGIGILRNPIEDERQR